VAAQYRLGCQPVGTRHDGDDDRSPLIAYFIAAIAVAMLAAATGSADLSAGIVLGLVVAVGFAGSILAVTAAFETTKPQPWTWFGISFGYHLIGLVVTAVIVSVWV
jgi:Protein of unknown function (DUF1761)